MKCLIIYFSQTGSTKIIARAIYQGIKSTTSQCDFTSIAPGVNWQQIWLKSLEISRLVDYDLIGIGSCVINFTVPDNVGLLLDNFPPLQGKYAFIFATHAMGRGEIIATMAERLQFKGITVIGYRSWFGTVWTQWSSKPYLTEGHPDEIDLKEARDFGKQMVSYSQRIRRGETILIPEIPSPKPIPDPGVFCIRLTYDRGRCTYPRCQLCMNYCPMGVIDLSAEPIVFQEEGCIFCYFCEKICPTGAINGDWKSLAVLWRDQFLRGAYEATRKGERKGYFRKLIKDIDDNAFLYKVVSKRPRFKIGGVTFSKEKE